LNVLLDAEPASGWEQIKGTDGTINFGTCINDRGSACPNIDWKVVEDNVRGNVLQIQHGGGGDTAFLDIGTETPKNLSAYASGDILFDIKTIDGSSTHYFDIECVYPCNAGGVLLENVGENEWESITISIATLVEAGLNLETINTGIRIIPSREGTTILLDNVRWINSVNTDDSDGDGILDESDAFPLDASESVDTDSDGIGNNADKDDDDDGIYDFYDAFPLDASEAVDTDSDGIGNNADADDDGDGVSDSSDVRPLDRRYSLDSDSDGIPDAFEDANGLNKYVASDADSDSDGDGLSALQEFGYGTSPTKKDTDSDTLPDGWEVENGRNPTLSDYPVATSFNHAILTDGGPKYLGELKDGFSSPELSAPNFIALNDENKACGTSSAGGGACTGIRMCVLDQSKAKCWTQSYGYKSDGSAFQSHTLEQEKEFDNPSEIAISVDTACVIDEQVVDCWTIGGWSTPTDGRFLFKNPRNLLVSNRSACVISDEGLKCWGYGDLYKPESVSDRLVSPYLIKVEGLNGSLPNGIGPLCGLDQVGIFCWAYLEGQYVYDIENVPSFLNPHSLSMARGRACSLDDKGLTCWGASGDPVEALSNSFVNPKAIFAGRYITCGIDDYGLLCDGFGKVSRPELLIDPDNDGFSSQGGSDAFPLDSSEWLDTDLDGTGNNADSDDDGDSVLDVDDTFPLDASESADTDGDGVGDNSDAFPSNALETTDSDLDSIGDNTDNCISIANTDQLNSDDDLLGNACDDDDDNDGVSDEFDALPLDASEQLDTDGDGIGNNADEDDDNDGVTDNSDAYPLNNLYSADSDGDGMPDAWELLYGLDPNDPSDASSDTDNDGAVALQEFIEGTIPSGSLDIDGNEKYDALTDGLLLLRGMFGLDGSALVTGTIASDAAYTESADIESRIATLGDLADIDGNGEIDALTDGLLTLRYLFGLQGDTLINGVVAGDATRKTAEEIEAHLETLMPAL